MDVRTRQIYFQQSIFQRGRFDFDAIGEHESPQKLSCRDAAVQDAVLADVTGFALRRLAGAVLIGTMDSPITGTDGNREFLLGLKKHK